MMIIIFLLLSLIINLSISARVLSSGSEFGGINSIGINGINNIGGGSIPSPLRPSPVVPSPFSNTQRSLPAIKVDPKGKAYTTQILKQQLANELGLPLRDLRIVDPSFPSQIQATFTSRPNAILFCIENIKVVVQNDEALVFSPYQPEVQEFVPALQQQIIQSTNGDNTVPTRFEHIVLEAALNIVCSNLLRRVRALAPSVASALAGLRAESRGLDVIITQVDELLPLKNKIDELRKRAKEIKRAITEILSNDEDMAMMYLKDKNPINKGDLLDLGVLSGGILIETNNKDGDITENNQQKQQQQQQQQQILMTTTTDNKIQQFDTMNLEMLFENYLNEIEWIASEVEEMIDEITNTEENVVLQLDLLRNRILRFELNLSIASFVVTCGALVTGLFGMNLLNHMELNSFVFYIVTALLASGMAGIFTSLIKYGKREKLL